MWEYANKVLGFLELLSLNHKKYIKGKRMSEEAKEMQHELIELQKHISAQGILVQDLMTGVSYDHKTFLVNIDVLLAEHKVDEALEAFDAEDKNSLVLKSSGDALSTGDSSYKAAFLRKKVMLEDQLVEITEQHFISVPELKKALSALIKLGKGPSAHQALLKFYGSHIQKNIKLILDTQFIVEIARFVGYPSQHVHQIATAIIARAIGAFSARSIVANKALPEDEWFVEAAKSAINKPLLVAEGSETSEIDEGDMILHDDVVSDSDETVSSLSTEESFESFV
ncbi:Cullin repeat-like-containing domain containing protein [Trema orientale]|uniref:Cullin repeat-like-containing domain containing protein n=1 Tax=Trema orientale TaxID=63057 RepID=A0A2P5DLJ9_TREOI|nr:Cullin repeat-like-containing domain containing protein [Trema orientale]